VEHQEDRPHFNCMGGFDLKRGGLRGPGLTHGRTSDHLSPFNEDVLPAGSLSIADVGYVSWARTVARRAEGSYTLTRAPARTMFWTPEGKRWELEKHLPQRVGQTNQCWVRVADQYRYLMRLLMIRVPKEVAQQRRAALVADAARRQREVSTKALHLADWTLLRDRCSCQPTHTARGSRAGTRTLANRTAFQAMEAIWMP